jgi:hypothetical protein
MYLQQKLLLFQQEAPPVRHVPQIIRQVPLEELVVLQVLDLYLLFLVAQVVMAAELV